MYVGAPSTVGQEIYNNYSDLYGGHQIIIAHRHLIKDLDYSKFLIFQFLSDDSQTFHIPFVAPISYFHVVICIYKIVTLYGINKKNIYYLSTILRCSDEENSNINRKIDLYEFRVRKNGVNKSA